MLKAKSLFLFFTLFFSLTLTAQTVIFDNWNKGGVSNWPDGLTMFELTQPTKISEIVTYHWNNGQGSTGNTFGPYIKLYDIDNFRKFGPWKATLTGGSYRTKNVTWTAHPNEVLPPGIYVVKVSDPITWSHNNGSEGCGFVRVISGGSSRGGRSVSSMPRTSTSGSVTGTWNSSFGDLTLSQNGNTVSGTYTADNGKISGTLNGHTFTGRWSEAPTYSGPNDAGPVKFEFSDNWSSFSGKWGYEGKSLSGNWAGSKK